MDFVGQLSRAVFEWVLLHGFWSFYNDVITNIVKSIVHSPVGKLV